ncbi:MAG TPA: amidase [Terriglobia bacterium]|nr:amidase [Terriglobia bacterium]
MAPLAELAFADGLALAELVRSKQVQPLELIEAAIERIDRLNPALNAVVTPMYEQARAQAGAPLPDGPFRGVPFLLKDLLGSYAGVRQTWGSAYLRDFVPDHDSELVTRLKKAGLVILGKTNAPEFGILPTTEPRLFGPSRNPWATTHSTGGSSGGSAAAVAAGMVPMAHANDGGGSIRIPASCCGLFGLKPTRARNPLGPDLGDSMGGLVAEHALTRSVRDSAALLDATCGPDTGDPYWAPPPARPFREEVGRDPGRLRIALTRKAPTGVPVHPDCEAAVEDAARLCASLGHEVEEASPALEVDLYSRSFIAAFSTGVAAAIDGFAYLTRRTPTPDQFEPLTWGVYEMGRQVSGPAYALAHIMLQRTSRSIAHFMLKYDSWLTPTVAEPPPPHGSFDSPPENPLAGFLRATQFVPFTPVSNATGQPAMSVPLYWNGEGLPVGVHFAGRFGDEATLFRLAAQLEAARPWAHRRPPVAA